MTTRPTENQTDINKCPIDKVKIPFLFWGDSNAIADFICLYAIRGVNEGLWNVQAARSMSYSKYIIYMDIKPILDAKDFYKIFDSMWEGNKRMRI